MLEVFPIKQYVICAEDLLEIYVWDNENLNRTVEVSTRGTFIFPRIGKVYAEGISVFELEELIERRLGDGYLVVRDGYLVAPQVIVNVVSRI